MSKDRTRHLTKGQLIRQARMLAGEQQNEFAEHLGYSPSYICKLEYGERQPSMEFSLRLKEQYHTDLLYRNEPSPPFKAKPKKDIDVNQT